MRRKDGHIGHSNTYFAIKTKTRGNLTSKAILEKKMDLVKILSEELECKLVGIPNLIETLKVLFKDTDIKYAYSETTGYINIIINGNIEGSEQDYDITYELRFYKYLNTNDALRLAVQIMEYSCAYNTIRLKKMKIRRESRRNS